MEKVNRYIPSLVLSQVIASSENQKRLECPLRQSMRTAVLWADISGFTALGEKLNKNSLRGAEELAQKINEFMAKMITLIESYGGDIIKFVGDAMICMWPEGGSDAEQVDKVI